jgi:hypothetical protein
MKNYKWLQSYNFCYVSLDPSRYNELKDKNIKIKCAALSN